jgi:hypothetical protein
VHDIVSDQAELLEAGGRCRVQKRDYFFEQVTRQSIHRKSTPAMNVRDDFIHG